MGHISKHPTLQVNHPIVPVAIATENASRSFSAQSHPVSKLPCNKWIHWLHGDSCIIFWSRNAFSVQWALSVPSVLQHLPSLIYVSQSNGFQKEGSFLKTLASCLSPQGKWCDLSDYWAWGKRQACVAQPHPFPSSSTYTSIVLGWYHVLQGGDTHGRTRAAAWCLERVDISSSGVQDYNTCFSCSFKSILQFAFHQ